MLTFAAMNGIALGLLIPLMGTVVGSGFVFLMRKEMPQRLQKWLLGFASGVMVAASVWSLLIPSMEMQEDAGQMAVVPAAVGFLLGMGFLLCLDYITPHLHLGDDHPEGPRSRLSRTAMLTLAVTLHNLPEGMAVGVVLAGALQAGTGITAASALALSLGIACHHLDAYAGGGQFALALVCDWGAERRGGAYRGIVGYSAGWVYDSDSSLYAFVCSWSHDVCGHRRTYPRECRGRA